MTATMLLATVELAVVDSDAVEPANARSKSARLWLATLWLSLSLAFKPLALPMLLLVARSTGGWHGDLFWALRPSWRFPFFSSPPIMSSRNTGKAWRCSAPHRTAA